MRPISCGFTTHGDRPHSELLGPDSGVEVGWVGCTRAEGVRVRLWPSSGDGCVAIAADLLLVSDLYLESACRFLNGLQTRPILSFEVFSVVSSSHVLL